MKNLILISVIGLVIIGCGVKNPIRADKQKLKIDTKISKQVIKKKGGKCYKEVKIPAVYRYVKKRVPKILKSFKYGTKKVLVKKEHYKNIERPKYQYSRKKVLIKPESYRVIKTPSRDIQIKVPAVFKYKMVKKKIGISIIKVKVPAVFKQIATKIPTQKTVYSTEKVKTLITPTRIENRLVNCK